MGMREQILDTFGVKEHFVTELGEIEDAGNGLMRVVRCIRRHGVLVPVFSQIIPAIAVMESLPIVTEMAHRILRGDRSRH